MHWNPELLKLLADERTQERQREVAHDRLVGEIRRAAPPKPGDVTAPGLLHRIAGILLPRRQRPLPQPASHAHGAEERTPTAIEPPLTPAALAACAGPGAPHRQG